MSVLSATILLILVLDPFGNIPAFLSTLKNIEPSRRRIIIFRELCIALGVLIIFLFVGRYILSVLQISQSSLGIAGGIILFLIAIKMIFAGSEKVFADGPEGEPLIVPLAIPFVAGPSSMATVILLMAREPSRWLEWLLSLVCAWIISGAILLSADCLSRVLGNKVLTAAERLMGLILTTVAVEMFVTGFRQSLLS